MIKPAALVMGVLMAGVSTGTYYGLQLLPPGTLPPPLGLTPKEEPPPPGAQDVFAPAPTQPPTDVAAAPKPAEEPMTEGDLAEEPAPEPASVPAPEAAAASASAPEAAAEPAEEPNSATTEVARAETGEAVHPPADEKPAPGWGSKAAAKPAPQSEPGPQPAPAAGPAPRAATLAKAESASPAAPMKNKPPDADVIKPWWPDPAKMPANQLKLQYAGQVKGEQAIALLFTAPVKLDSLKQHGAVRTTEGRIAQGEWELGKNPRLAVFRGVKTGRYTVILQPQVADQKGFMLGTTLQGPVYIKEP